MTPEERADFLVRSPARTVTLRDEIAAQIKAAVQEEREDCVAEFERQIERLFSDNQKRGPAYRVVCAAAAAIRSRP